VITGTTRIFLMLAHPIEHVRSPEVFNPIFAARGIDAVMVPLHLRPETFAIGWEGMRRMENLGGFVVSIPLKEAAFHLSDEVDETAAAVSAANTVRREASGRMVCANFDGPGFMVGVLDGGRDATGRRVLLVGAGGAGASIAFSLMRAGIASLTLCDLDHQRAEALAARVRARHPAAAVTVGENDPRGHDLVINATPSGLHPEADPLPVMVEHLDPAMLVADIIMKPAMTPLLAAAKARGCAVRQGAGMLDCQVELMMRFLGY
jgi:shikimate dehydrogenase